MNIRRMNKICANCLEKSECQYKVKRYECPVIKSSDIQTKRFFFESTANRYAKKLKKLDKVVLSVSTYNWFMYDGNPFHRYEVSWFNTEEDFKLWEKYR